jgi:hypothetical protein
MQQGLTSHGANLRTRSFYCTNLGHSLLTPEMAYGGGTIEKIFNLEGTPQTDISEVIFYV